MEMFQVADKPHLQAMEKMKMLMHTPDAMQKWFTEKQKMFEAMPEIN